MGALMDRAPRNVRRRRPLGRHDGAPGLQRLLSDIKAGKVQIIVVYKVDRLTRSLADEARYCNGAAIPIDGGYLAV